VLDRNHAEQGGTGGFGLSLLGSGPQFIRMQPVRLAGG
jgi:hypothetical protein